MSTADRAEWHSAVAPYVGPDVGRSVIQLTTTLGLYAAGVILSYWASSRSLLLTLVAVPVASLLMVRTFMLMHDCTHGSFFPSRRANDIVGVLTGLLAFTPFGQWRRDHAIHHASSGDLDRRGHGDITTWTVTEYLSKTAHQRRMYRLYRHPIFLVMGGPVFLFITLRFRAKGKGTGAKQVTSIWGTNIAIVAALGGAYLLWGWRAIGIYGLVFYLGAAVGVWLFYVQHQFEDTYWEQHRDWDYETSAMRGSSHLSLPPVLRWFSASIGLHHVHHLAPRIPNYKLQRCHDENPRLQSAPVITIWSGLSALRLALWDEEGRRLVRFRDVDAGKPNAGLQNR